jgi:N-methylhydantoinase A
VLLGVDVGGTFTDAVLAGDGRVVTAKAPSTPRDQSEGVMAAVAAALEKAGIEAGDVESFAHGMTVATNALLEGTAARTALVATEGFTDVVELGRQARRELYRLCAAHPAPLVPPDLRFAAPERAGAEGVERALSEEDATRIADEVAAAEVESVAVVLLHAYRHHDHELRLGEALREALGDDVHVSLSHAVAGTFREYERAATTEIDAALSPLLARYLRALGRRAGEAGLTAPSIMQSNGGLVDAEAAAGHAAWTVLSGPAGGAAGAAYAALAAGVRDVVCFDMGGTSCDVCVVDDGSVRETQGREVGGRTISLPMLDVHTVGAGGGSIGWRDPGGALRVGPHSAGAEPGPAAYGRGGEEPTVTDANLVLGRLPAGGSLAGGVELDLDAATAAVERLAGELDMAVRDCAEGIVRIANTEMLRALRVMTVERGVDPRGYALMAFGGAGGLHAAAIADELGCSRVLCPRAGGVLAALGLVVSPGRRDAQRSVLLAGDDLERERIAGVVEELGEAAREAVGAPDAELRSEFDLRYRGQAFELTVREDPEPGRLREAFEATHEERYGYRDEDGELELVTVRVSAIVPGSDVRLEAAQGEVEEDARTVVFAGEEHEARVLRGDLPAGTEVAGPAICELPEATVAVPPGWSGSVHESGALTLERNA